MHLILYDGVCGFCNGLVRFVSHRDRADVFRFAALQSPIGEALSRKYGASSTNLDTAFLIINYRLPGEALLARSQVMMFVLPELGGFWRITRLLSVLPSSWLNLGYDFVAKHRYSWFGRFDR